MSQGATATAARWAGKGVVGIASAWTRCGGVEERLGARNRRSRTICGMSMRCMWLIVPSLRCDLSFVRCGDGDRLMSITLSFLERAGLTGGVGSEWETERERLRRRLGGRTAAL